MEKTVEYNEKKFKVTMNQYGDFRINETAISLTGFDMSSSIIDKVKYAINKYEERMSPITEFEKWDGKLD